MGTMTMLNKIPRWTILVAGAAAGISLLSILLRNALATGEETTLLTFSAMHFAGYLFFIISPVEILYVHMLNQGHPVFSLYGLALGTALLAQAIDYAMGRAFSDTVIHRIIGEKKYRRNLRRIETYGGWTIFVFCLLPLSSPIVILVAGMIRYSLFRVFVFSTVGLALKYGVLNLMF